MPADEFGLVGQTLDQLRFEKVVDGGGFGLVYRAIHTGLDEPVAVKCLRLHHNVDPDLVDSFFQRFKDETRILYRLSQGSLDIVRGISSGTLVSPRTGEDVPYMVLEWLEGQPLSSDPKTRARSGQRYSLDEAFATLEPVMSALAHAHSQGIVHRDIKPQNLFFTKTRAGTMRLKVLDFGLAKIFEPTLGVTPSVQTQGGVALCSPSYGAPEQFLQRYGAVGPWTDVYALGLVFLELLACKKARHAASLVDGLSKIVAKETASPTPASLGLTLPKEVCAVLERAVAQTPAERQADAAIFRAELIDAIERSKAAPSALATTVTVEDDERPTEVPVPRNTEPILPSPSSAPTQAASTVPTPTVPTPAPIPVLGPSTQGHFGQTLAFGSGALPVPPAAPGPSTPPPPAQAQTLPSRPAPSVPPGRPSPAPFSPPTPFAHPMPMAPAPAARLSPVPPPAPRASEGQRPAAAAPGRSGKLALAIGVVLAAIALVASYIYMDTRASRAVPAARP